MNPSSIPSVIDDYHSGSKFPSHKIDYNYIALNIRIPSKGTGGIMEHHASIELQMSLLLFIALSGYFIASWLKQPAVVGQILSGLIIGPSVLGWITYTEFVASTAHLGAIILLFVVGLEFKLKEISSPRYVLIAAIGMAFPWGAGFYTAQLFGFETTKAALIGVALAATSIAITADTLRELGQLHSKAAKAIIGAAVIDDVLALLALSLVNSASQGNVDTVGFGLLALKAVIFLAAGMASGRYLITPAAHRIDQHPIARQFPDLVFVFAMMLAFVYAIIAELMGLSAIVGAFLAGVSFEGVNLKQSRPFREGAEYLRILFGAVFFVSLGVIADLRILTWDALWFALTLSVVAFLSKLLGCGLTALSVGMGKHDAFIIGVGMAPRGEVAMVIALMALSQGIIEQSAYVAMVIMSLLTTLIVPLILRRALTEPTET
jgi:Kef-type K+ transport system membrane component KefB